MGKHARKRQRKDKPPPQPVVPLGAAVLLDDDADKDDEERRLESLLFGKPFVSGRGTKVTASEVVEDENDGADVTAAELEGMLDSDVSYIIWFIPSRNVASRPFKLFFVDDGATKARSTIGDDIDVSPPENNTSSSLNSGDEESSEEDTSIANEHPDGAQVPNTSPSVSHLPKSREASAWTDPDDASLEVSLASSARLRKLRDAPEEDTVNGREYERRLRRQFVKMNPTPQWATSSRRGKRRRRRAESDTDAHADADEKESTVDLDALLASSGGILGQKRRAHLEPGVLAIERLRDANQAAQAEGEVTASQFHPSPQVSMLLVASTDRRIRLFNVRVWFLSHAAAAAAATHARTRSFTLTLKLTKRRNQKHRSTDTRTRISKPFTSPRCPSPTRSSTRPAPPSFSPDTARFITRTTCNLAQQRGHRAGCGARPLRMATKTRT